MTRSWPRPRSQEAPGAVRKLVGDLADSDLLRVGPRAGSPRGESDDWVARPTIGGFLPLCTAPPIRAIETVRRVCAEELGGHVDLEVIDVRQQPACAMRDRVGRGSDAHQALSRPAAPDRRRPFRLLLDASKA